MVRVVDREMEKKEANKVRAEERRNQEWHRDK